MAACIGGRVVIFHVCIKNSILKDSLMKFALVTYAVFVGVCNLIKRDLCMLAGYASLHFFPHAFCVSSGNSDVELYIR